jgi:carbon-monoxide dehydrogenase medium subunit
MQFSDFVIPKTLGEAQEALKALGRRGRTFAGGTAFQYISDRPDMTAVDITRLGLDGIEKENGGFRIGATTTLAELVRYRADGWVLGRVATRIPTHQVRNISTIGGNICRLFPWSDLPLAILVLEGSIVLQGDEEKIWAAKDFLIAQPRSLIAHGELVTAVTVPAVAPPLGFGFRKETTTNAAFALVAAAAAITLEGCSSGGGRLGRVRLAANGALPIPMRLEKVEQALEGQPADAGLFKAAIEEGIADLEWQGREGMSDEFARHLAGVILRDALNEAFQAAQEKTDGSGE